MKIPYITAAVIQITLDVLLIAAIIFTFYLVISLIIKVRSGKKVDKMKNIKKIVIYTLVIELLLLSINILFKYDPLGIIEEPKGDIYIIQEE
ncbi:MAG TPA: hypothetical protein PLK49_01835 [Candidatus Dojkabacteria bacterium]|nr:hypothetical protein [Candidatus Dojkabacteria bacterium]